MWKLELDYDFYRIYDSNQMIVGYFDPNYGDIYPEEKSEEIIIQMIKNHDNIPGGFLTLPFVKFGLFDTSDTMNFDYVKDKIDLVSTHLDKWNKFISETNNLTHSIHLSHTDQDMLSITFPIRFSEPVPLDIDPILKKLVPTLDLLQKINLL